MKSQEPAAIPVKHNLLLAILGLIGVGIILLATNRYGAVLSHDSVVYVATARHIANGAGIVTYDGRPLLNQPPLYPAILAAIDYVFGLDPLSSANIVNAVLFGLIVYLGGLLTCKHLSSFPAYALVGTLAILFSSPLFRVSVSAWSEPLFICLVLLGLIFASSYPAKNDATSLVLFSSSVALSSLTRYIGVTLILWGALTILIFHRNSLKNRIAHLSLFTIISALPLGLWLFRNYTISSTLLGPRPSSAFTLSQNLTRVFGSLLYWYVPRTIAEHRSILMIVIAGVGLFAGLSFRDSWQGVKVRLRQINPIILFAIIYTAFLVISSTTTGYDKIGDRLLSPIYVPLTLLLLILAEALADSYRKRFPKKVVNSFLIIGVAIWLVCPIRSTIFHTAKLITVGEGYGGKAWMESETVQYLLQHQTLVSECTFYTNGPDAAYILAHLAAKMSPSKTGPNSPGTVNDISRLRGSWPEESNACLVWFDKIRLTHLLTVDELQAAANVDLIARLEDGAIYSITRK